MLQVWDRTLRYPRKTVRERKIKQQTDHTSSRRKERKTRSTTNRRTVSGPWIFPRRSPPTPPSNDEEKPSSPLGGLTWLLWAYLCNRALPKSFAVGVASSAPVSPAASSSSALSASSISWFRLLGLGSAAAFDIISFSLSVYWQYIGADHSDCRRQSGKAELNLTSSVTSMRLVLDCSGGEVVGIN